MRDPEKRKQQMRDFQGNLKAGVILFRTLYQILREDPAKTKQLLGDKLPVLKDCETLFQKVRWYYAH